jgi:hypothetical protein
MGLALVAAAVLAVLALVLLPLLPEDDLVGRSLRWRSQVAVALLIPEGVALVLVVAWLRLLRALVARAVAPLWRRQWTKSGRAVKSQRHDRVRGASPARSAPSLP